MTPFERDIVPPEILPLDKILTLLVLEGPSPYVYGIFWHSDVIKVVQVDHFLKNALQNFTKSNISLSGHFPPPPKPQTKIFLNHCDAIRTSKEEIFCPPPCRETTCSSTDRVMCG